MCKWWFRHFVSSAIAAEARIGISLAVAVKFFFWPCFGNPSALLVLSQLNTARERVSLDVETCNRGAKVKGEKTGSNVGWQPDINKCNAHGPSDALALQTKGPRISREPTPPPRGEPPKKVIGYGGATDRAVGMWSWTTVSRGCFFLQQCVFLPSFFRGTITINNIQHSKYSTWSQNCDSSGCDWKWPCHCASHVTRG